MVRGGGSARETVAIILFVVQSGRRKRKTEARDESEVGIEWEAKEEGGRERKEEAERTRGRDAEGGTSK